MLLLSAGVMAGFLSLGGTFASFQTERSALQQVQGGMVSVSSGVGTIEQSFGQMVPGDRGTRVWQVVNSGTLSLTDITLQAKVLSYSDSKVPSSSVTDLTSQINVRVDWCEGTFNAVELTCSQWSLTPLFLGTLEDLASRQSLDLPSYVLAAPGSDGAKDLNLRLGFHASNSLSPEVEGGAVLLEWGVQGDQPESRNDI